MAPCVFTSVCPLQTARSRREGVGGARGTPRAACARGAMFAPLSARSGEARLTYDTDLTPEEEIELLYAPPQGSSLHLAAARPGSPAHRHTRPAASRRHIITSLAAGLDDPSAHDAPTGPFHKRVWYPKKAPPPAEGTDGAVAGARKKAGPQLLKLILQSVSPNLKLVVVGLWAEAEEVKGTARISLAGYADALKGLGVDNVELINETFDILQQDKDAMFVSLEDVLAALEIVVNGRGANGFVQRAFDLFAGLGGQLYYSGQVPQDGFDKNDFIHVAKLMELRRLRVVERMPPRNYLMVKTLISLFAHQRKMEEENFLMNFGKKGKKKPKKKKPPQMSALRLRDEMKDFHRTRHISLKEFAASMATNNELVRAFLPIALAHLVDDKTLLHPQKRLSRTDTVRSK